MFVCVWIHRHACGCGYQWVPSLINFDVGPKLFNNQQNDHTKKLFTLLILISHHTNFLLSSLDFLLHQLSIHLSIYLSFTTPFLKPTNQFHLSLSIYTQEARHRGESSSLFCLFGYILIHTLCEQKRTNTKRNLCSFDLLPPPLSFVLDIDGRDWNFHRDSWRRSL